MTKEQLCAMCFEHGDEPCEHESECKLQKILAENKRLKKQNEKLKLELSWIESPERMGR